MASVGCRSDDGRSDSSLRDDPRPKFNARRDLLNNALRHRILALLTVAACVPTQAPSQRPPDSSSERGAMVYVSVGRPSRYLEG